MRYRASRANATRQGQVVQRNGQRRRRLLIGLVIGLVAGFAATVRLFDVPALHVPVTMDMVATTTGRTVHIDGTTDLPDGARIEVGAWPYENEHQVYDGPGGLPRYRVVDTVTVTGGRFSHEADLTGWPSGMSVQVEAYFEGGVGQPLHVIWEFGLFGQRMGGPQVEVDDFFLSSVKYVLVMRPVTVGD